MYGFIEVSMHCFLLFSNTSIYGSVNQSIIKKGLKYKKWNKYNTDNVPMMFFIIHPCDPTVVICYLIWPCDIAVRITYLLSHSSSLRYNTVIKGYFRLGV